MGQLVVPEFENQDSRGKDKRHDVGDEYWPIIQKNSVGSPHGHSKSEHALRNQGDALGSFVANDFYGLRSPTDGGTDSRETPNSLEPNDHGFTRL